jgi:Photosynthesis system II assembly factor YCF48
MKTADLGGHQAAPTSAASGAVGGTVGYRADPALGSNSNIPLHLPVQVAPFGGVSHGPARPTQQQQMAQVQQQNARMPAPVPSASEVVTVAAPAVSQPAQAQSGPIQGQNLEGQSQIAQANEPSDKLFDSSPGLVRAKPAVKAEFGPRWMITPTGGLQRSFDEGNSWQDVSVAASPAPPASGRNVSALMATPATEAQQQAPAGQAVAKQTAQKKAALAPAPVFRVVTSTGSEVWAGGVNAALYHSVDTGNSWIHVVPSAGGATLTGDVIRLEFADPQHGQIVTSTPEIWSTSDGGQTWQKQ